MKRRTTVPIEEIKVVKESKQLVVSCDGPGCTTEHVADSDAWSKVKDMPTTWFTVHGGDCWSTRPGERQLCSLKCLKAYVAKMRRDD